MAAKYCEPCNERGITHVAFRYCSECEETLCSECTEGHKVQKLSRNHNLLEISKIPKIINLSYDCSKHQHLPFDYFCADHDVLCCKECWPQNHRECKNVTSIDFASKNYKQSQSFFDSEEQVSFILEALEILNNNCRENKSPIEQQETTIRQQIAKMKENIIKQFESLEESLLNHLTEMKNKHFTRLKVQDEYIGDLVTSSKAEKDALEFVRDYCSEKQAFVSIQSSKAVLDEIENKVKQLSESSTDTSLTFVESVSKEQIADFGSIELKETHCSFPFVPYKLRQSQVPVVPTRQMSSFTHLYDIDMKGESLKAVTGIMISDNNTLIFCGVNTKKVYFCDANDSYQSSVICPYAPWDIVAIPGSTTAVMSSRFEPFIQFLDIESRKIFKEVEVEKSESVGISASKDGVFVALVGQIQVLDLNGNFKKTFYLKQAELRILYIFVCSNGNICYSSRSSVFCITSDGCPVFRYASSNIRYPRNTITDNAGNLYVLDCDSNNIHQLTSTGTLIDILLNDSLSSPFAFCFSKDLSKVYIANKCGHKMSVFKTHW